MTGPTSGPISTRGSNGVVDLTHVGRRHRVCCFPGSQEGDMKLSISALISAVFLFGLVTMGVAQTDLSPAPSKAPPSAPSSEPAKPSSEPAKPSQDVKTDNRSTTVESRSDSS